MGIVIGSQQFAALRESVFLDAVGQKAEVTDAREAIGEDMEQKAANKLLGIQRHRFFSISVWSIPVAQGHFAVVNFKDTVVGQSHTMGVAAEVIEHSLWRAERLFGVDDPAFLVCGFDLVVGRWNFFLSQRPALTGRETFLETPHSVP
jgi:hypothetical protein